MSITGVEQTRGFLNSETISAVNTGEEFEFSLGNRFEKNPDSLRSLCGLADGGDRRRLWLLCLRAFKPGKKR